MKYKINITSEELVDAEINRQFADKMKACPFFAGMKRGDALEAMKNPRVNL